MAQSVTNKVSPILDLEADLCVCGHILMITVVGGTLTEEHRRRAGSYLSSSSMGEVKANI